MSDVALPSSVAPDPPRRRILRIAAWIVGTLVALAALHLAGIDVLGWFEDLWSTLTEISLGYIILGCLFQGLQTVLTALGWYGILRYAYPGGVTYMPVLAAYADGRRAQQLRAGEHGHLRDAPDVRRDRPGSDVPGRARRVRGAEDLLLRHRHAIYVYLFSQVAGSFDFQFGNEQDAIANHPVLTLGIIGGAIFLVALLLRVFWAWVKKMWARAMQGAAILGDLRAYVKLVLLPQIGGYAAKVMVIVVFLAAYGIPVTFGSVMSVLGSNQLANILSFTPGGIGVNQAFNTFALGDYTDDTTATAYSLGQQLITTAFNVGFAILLICIVFGWQGGSKLVKDSYDGAKVKKEEMSADRKDKRETKREARREEGRKGLMRGFRRSGDEERDGDG